MSKQLSDMTLEELWELFPITINEHNPKYKDWYKIEKENLLNVITADNIARISHIGSSAVEGLLSKPTIDILLEIDGGCNIEKVIVELERAGWRLMLQQYDPMRLSFCKGYTPDGFAEKVYHLHVVYYGNCDQLYFRDLLIARPDIAAEYGQLKLCLLKEFEHDRDGYTKAKTDFIMEYSALAKQLYANRYKPK